MWFYEILGVWTLYYLGTGAIIITGIFSWRKDMWSMVKDVLGVYGWLKYIMAPLAILLFVVIWPIVLILAIRRVLLKRPNIAEANEYETVKKNTDGTVSKEQVKELEEQVNRKGPGVVRGQLKTQLRKNAYLFIKAEYKKGNKEITVDEILVNVDKSPEFLEICELIGYPRSEMVQMCLDLGAVEKKEGV